MTNLKHLRFLINRSFLLVLLSGVAISTMFCFSSNVHHHQSDYLDENAKIALRKTYEKGKKMWFDANLGANGRSCESCHPGGDLTNAEEYPRYKHVLKTMATLSMTHNFAVVNESKGKAWELGSEDANAMVYFVTSLANGKKMRMAPPDVFKKEWVEKGKTLFTTTNFGNTDQTCESCHLKGGKNPFSLENRQIPALKGVAARFPNYCEKLGRVITLEQQINYCLEKFMNATPLALDDKNIVALSCYLTSLSEGTRISLPRFD